jgi:hypothetical protein
MPWLVWVKVYRVWSRMPAPRVDTELVELSYELVEREVQGKKVRRRISTAVSQWKQLKQWRWPSGCIYGRLG